MIERMNSPNPSPPGYSHVVIASGDRLVTPAGAVPLDALVFMPLQVEAARTRRIGGANGRRAECRREPRQHARPAAHGPRGHGHWPAGGREGDILRASLTPVAASIGLLATVGMFLR